MANINWFPGHMAKTVANLKLQKNNFDMLIQVVDARAIKTSSNFELLDEFNKPILTIAMKHDLSDANFHENCLLISNKNHKSKKTIIDHIQKTLEPKIIKMKAKGLVNPQFNILVVGMPNVGKSSLINFLLNKNNLVTQNRPGVTKKQTLVKISNSLFLNDTPGVLIKKIDEFESGCILGLVGCIKKEVLPINEVVKFAYEYHLKFYEKKIYNKFDINQHLKFDEFIHHICNKYGFIKNKNVNDTERALDYLYFKFLNGEVCKINYEK